MTDEKRRPTLTIVGMPTPEFLRSNGGPLPSDPTQLVNDWKLQPYRDVRNPTPSHSRPLRERGVEVTPVYVQPRRADPPRARDATVTLRSRVQTEPSAHAKRMAAVLVGWVLAIWSALAYGGWLPPG